MGTYEVKPAQRPLAAVVPVPGSATLARQAMLAAALADGTSRLTNLPLADDTRCLLDALRALGVLIRPDEFSPQLEIKGTGGYWPHGEADVPCGNASAVLYLLAAACSAGRGRYRLHGGESLRQQPLGEMINALTDLGAMISCAGYLPIHVAGSGLEGGTVCFSSSAAGAVASGILLAAPCARTDVFIEIARDPLGCPALAQTVGVMEAFGVTVVHDRTRRLIVPAPQRYKGAAYFVEPDAAIAVIFLAAAAIAGGSVTVERLGTSSIQPEVGFVDLLQRMGCQVDQRPDRLRVTGPAHRGRLHGVDVDLNTMPDTAPTLAAVALFADGPTRMSNVARPPAGEHHRLSVLARQLTGLGARVKISADGLTIDPPATVQPAEIDPAGDPGMAMSLTLAGLAAAGVVIRNPQCAGATCPEFFTRLEAMCR